jgi:YidC/Oxa1 family membrane protein insertase
MSGLFHTILYQPIFNIFVGLYAVIPDVGVAIILLTIIIKGVLYPLTAKSIKAQKALSVVQPKLSAVKNEHKGNQQKIAEETMKIYKEHNVNPLGSCLPVLIQLPVFLALYWVLRDGLGSQSLEHLYPFIPNPGHINPIAFGFLDLSVGKTIWSLILALLAGVAQWWQTKGMMARRPAGGTGDQKADDMANMMNKQMLYVLPVMTVIIGYQLPAGLALYWFLSTILTGLQQYYLLRDKPTDVVLTVPPTTPPTP